jgi:hypothetical protein
MEPGFLHEVPQELPSAHVECRRIAYQVCTWYGKSQEERLKPVELFMEFGEDLALHQRRNGETYLLICTALLVLGT